VGTVYVAVAGPGSARVKALSLSGDRGEVRAQSVLAALELLAEEVGVGQLGVEQLGAGQLGVRQLGADVGEDPPLATR
jgi:hypothetical protein